MQDNALIVLLKYISTDQFLNNPDYDLLNVVCELLSKIKFLQAIFELIYLFIIDIQKLIFFLLELIDHIENKRDQEYIPNQVFSFSEEALDEFFVIFDSFPFEIKFHFFVSSFYIKQFKYEIERILSKKEKLMVYQEE